METLTRLCHVRRSPRGAGWGDPGEETQSQSNAEAMGKEGGAGGLWVVSNCQSHRCIPAFYLFFRFF